MHRNFKRLRFFPSQCHPPVVEVRAWSKRNCGTNVSSAEHWTTVLKKELPVVEVVSDSVSDVHGLMMRVEKLLNPWTLSDTR